MFVLILLETCLIGATIVILLFFYILSKLKNIHPTVATCIITTAMPTIVVTVTVTAIAI